jgi:hypothetical protein
MTLQKYELYGIRHTYIEYSSGGVLTFKRAYLTKKCDLKVNGAQLEFSGDGQKYKKNYGYQASGTLEFDGEDNTISSILFGISSVSPQGGDDFASRYIHGTDAEMATNYVGVRITIDGADAATGAPIVKRIRIPKAQFSPDTPPAFQTESIVGRVVAFEARKATTDVVGTAITGMPTRGGFWIEDFITNSANFDPVSSDNW